MPAVREFTTDVSLRSRTHLGGGGGGGAEFRVAWAIAMSR